MEAFHLQVVEECPLPHPLLASVVVGPCLVLPKDIALAALEPFEIVADNRLPAASDSILETFLVCKIDDKIIALKFFVNNQWRRGLRLKHIIGATLNSPAATK